MQGASEPARLAQERASGIQPKQVCGKLLNTDHDGAHKLTRMEASHVPSYDAVPRCTVCNDAIGVYEPALVIERGSVRRTSLAREPALSGRSKLIHGGCAADAATDR